MFPNRETFVKREEFCITLMKLNRTCASAKRDFLISKFPSGGSKMQTILVYLLIGDSIIGIEKLDH